MLGVFQDSQKLCLQSGNTFTLITALEEFTTLDTFGNPFDRPLKNKRVLPTTKPIMPFPDLINNNDLDLRKISPNDYFNPLRGILF
jgi:hypothetical protein